MVVKVRQVRYARQAFALVFGLLAVTTTRSARAEDGARSGACSAIVLANVAGCAMASSAAVRAERFGVDAAKGRRTAAAPWFPANPTLALTASQRHGLTETPANVVNYSASLSQEVAFAGQRASNRRALDAEIGARSEDTTATSRRVIAAAYVAYFDALAARDALVVARRLEQTGEQVLRVTRARADLGVGSALDAEMGEATALRYAQARVEAERRERIALASLSASLGRDPLREGVRVDGVLEPLSGASTVAAAPSSELARQRPEVRAIHHEERAHIERAEAARRSRIPSITFQLFAQNDGFNERVLGGGIALPITLPQPVGHSYIGQIAESEALARQAASRAEQLARSFSGELAEALASYDAARAETALYTPERLTRAESMLFDIAKEIEAGRVAVRDAVVAQRELIDVVRGYIEARRSLSVASVDLLLASGASLEGRQP
ncbi:Heavy metal RND efflux outer membrane protein, CzcC family [Labilithrix luteola]|uniref:Heavy metal RND efflux outer membrane protein, CzcC family n=1 Tax=Labilithrix luteola TaxID=1391654 RepID=A0A0K1Q752_9BACT|nr:TolC family protein [Labilithrix luteola]AKV01554.1 Heavy metal RND efflux outer membrane protein, CzcC family [Labilithrix luteola]